VIGLEEPCVSYEDCSCETIGMSIVLESQCDSSFKACQVIHNIPPFSCIFYEIIDEISPISTIITTYDNIDTYLSISVLTNSLGIADEKTDGSREGGILIRG